MKARITFAHKNTNLGKLVKLSALQFEYRSYVQQCIDAMTTVHRHHVKPKEYQSFFAKSEVLSSQLQKCARAQAVNIVTTWVKALYSQLKRNIYENNFEPAFRSQLCMIGKCQLTQPRTKGKVPISEEALSTWWGWVWEQSSPKVKDDLPMWLSEMCVDFQAAKSAGSHGGWWARVSCLENGKRVVIPLASTPYLSDPDRLARSVLVGKRRGMWCFQFTDKEPVSEFEATERKVGVDVGLNVLAATSDGRLFGKRCKRRFDRSYARVRDVRRNRMRQGLYENSPRLNRMEQRLSGMVNTEVGRVAAKLVRAYPDTTFVVENLDLRGSRGSKRFAYRAVQRALEVRAPIQRVNAAYTSQACPSCGHVSRRNRRGTKFECCSCGRKSHADVVGGQNLLGRSEDKRIRAGDHYMAVGTLLRTRFRRRRASVVGRKGERIPLRQSFTVAPGRIATNAGDV